MIDPIPPIVKRAWERWNIRGTILFSLSLQTILILLAPYRKCTRKKRLILLIWSAYLLADAAANLAVGLISNSQGNNNPKCNSTSTAYKDNEDLLAFWAPFLLLHLGGPDNITAFALEDNELWIRHLLGFGFQAVAALYVFLQSLSNTLWTPVIFMFVAGTIKYVERTRALYLASSDRFPVSKQPNHDILVEEYEFMRETGLPVQIIRIPKPDKEARATDMLVKKGKMNDLEVVHYAYKYFNIFKRLVGDPIFSFHEWNESREFFKERNADDALQVIEVELNFLYEVLYTKVQVVHSAWGYIFRFIAFGATLAALGYFHLRAKKHEFNPVDVRITYTLLLGAIALEVVAFLMLIFSDWMFARFKDPGSDSGRLAKICRSFLLWRRPWWRKHLCQRNNYEVFGDNREPLEHHVLATPILFRRWSGSLSSYNLISYCLKNRNSTRIHKFHKFTGLPLVIAEKIVSFLHSNFLVKLIIAMWHVVIGSLWGVIDMLSFIKCKIMDGIDFVVYRFKRIPGLHHVIRMIRVGVSYVHSFIMESTVGVKDLFDELIYVSREPFTKELWEFIFNELKTKAEYAEDPETAKRISVSRGQWVLMDSDSKADHSTLMHYVTDVAYDESLLVWHIATDLCYYTPVDKKVDTKSSNYREISKLLSDYMLSLLIMQPTMMSAVGAIGNFRFRDTCAEAERFFVSKGLLSRWKKSRKNREIDACREILLVNTDVRPVDMKEDRVKSVDVEPVGDEPVHGKWERVKSVLFEATILAKELNELEKSKGLDKWKLISRMWVELISYAACKCKAKTHAQQISKGGELITIIWLLMAHFGLGEEFQINEGHGRVELIFAK